MIINFDIKLNIKSKFEKMDLPNLAHDKNLVPNNIKIYTGDENNLTYATDINFKFFVDNQDLVDHNRAYFHLLNNYVNLEDYKSYLSKGRTCQIWLNSYSDVMKSYKIVVEYVENFGYVFYQGVFEKTDKLFNEIKERGYCTRLIFSFSRKVKNLKMLSLINVSEIEDTDDWFYSFDINEEEDNVYMIDFTKQNKIYIKFLNFMKLMYEEMNKNDEDDALKIYVAVY